MLDVKHSPGCELGNGRFVVTGTLGSGAQAETLEALDKQNGNLVALKRFQVQTAQSWKDVELAEREAHVLAGLDHPLLPHYVAHFEEQGSLYLAMERIEGKTLQQLRGSGQFSQADALLFLQDMAVVLDYLHGRSPSIIHRDIKPRNIIRRPDGRFVVVDFGSVRDRLKPEGGSTVVGTFGYMAPEQFQGRAMPATDTYATAATALSLLTGLDPEQLPHKGLALDVGRALNGTVEPRLQNLLEQALEPDPDKRGARSLSMLLVNSGLLNGKPEGRTTPSSASQQARFASAAQNHKRRAQVRARHVRREHEAAAAENAQDSRRDERHASRLEKLAASELERAAQRIPPPVLLGLILLFTLLRVVLGVALRVVVPTVLNILGVLLFGPDLRRAANQVRQAGKEAQLKLREVQRRLRRGRAPRALRK